jgi:hypothetical protein
MGGAATSPGHVFYDKLQVVLIAAAAPRVAAWWGEYLEALPDPCRRAKPKVDHAAADWRRNASGVYSTLFAWLFVAPSPNDGLVVILCAVIGDQSALCAISVTPDAFG